MDSLTSGFNIMKQLLDYVASEPELQLLENLQGWTVVALHDDLTLEKVYGI